MPRQIHIPEYLLSHLRDALALFNNNLQEGVKIGSYTFIEKDGGLKIMTIEGRDDAYSKDPQLFEPVINSLNQLNDIMRDEHAESILRRFHIKTEDDKLSDIMRDKQAESILRRFHIKTEGDKKYLYCNKVTLCTLDGDKITLAPQLNFGHLELLDKFVNLIRVYRNSSFVSATSSITRLGTCTTTNCFGGFMRGVGKFCEGCGDAGIMF